MELLGKPKIGLSKTKEKDPQKKELSLHLKRILSLIPYDRTITASEISSITGYTTDNIRKSISRLVTVYHKPVGTFNTIFKGKGFKMITDTEEQSYTVENLRGRAKHILTRAEAIEKMKI